MDYIKIDFILNFIENDRILEFIYILNNLNYIQINTKKQIRKVQYNI